MSLESKAKTLLQWWGRRKVAGLDGVPMETLLVRLEDAKNRVKEEQDRADIFQNKLRTMMKQKEEQKQKLQQLKPFLNMRKYSVGISNYKYSDSDVEDLLQIIKDLLGEG